MTENLTITYLEMTDPGQLQGKYVGPETLTIRQVGTPLPALNRFFYQQVGQQWRWKQKLVWTDQQWADYVCRDEMRTYVGYQDGTPVGYFELERQDRDVEILYFGLLPPFIGQGLGGPFLTAAIEAAWAWTPIERVWLHTCTRDHEAALPNYQARGFRIYDERRP